MGESFDARLDGYDEHQLTCVDLAKEFYPFTAECLLVHDDCNIIDLGCGTGLEFKLVPNAYITGIDLAPGMLNALKAKFPNKHLDLILGSYFDVPFGSEKYDAAAVSVKSLHHFTKEEKIPLYKKLCNALKNEGYFILTDYFALSDNEEKLYRQELLRLKEEDNIKGYSFYHYDTPLMVEHETESLLVGGFFEVEILNNWGAAHTLKAYK